MLRHKVQGQHLRRIYGKPLGTGHTFVIGEIGSNFGNSLEEAIERINIVADAGADGVKFQLYVLEDISKVPQQKDRKWELPPEWIPNLTEAAHRCGLAFLCTPFAPWAVKFLNPYVDAWKVGSFEADSLLFTIHMLPSQKLVLTSTGMLSNHGLSQLKKRFPKVVYLHCVSKYPTSYREANPGRGKKLGSLWGYSSHTNGFTDVLVALTLGASIIEKHIKFGGVDSPDSGAHALPPESFKTMVQEIRNVDLMLRPGQKWNLAKPPFGRKLHGK